MSKHEMNKPIFATLTDDECRAVLSRNYVGRLAFMRENRVDIQPIGYVAAEAWLFMRSADGAK